MSQLTAQTFNVLEKCFRHLEGQVPPPKLKQVKGVLLLRYEEKSIHQALIQKLARYISSLHAAQILLDCGHVGEQAVLQRTLDEIGEDIQFLALAITNDKVTQLHNRYLNAFYAEEFENHGNPIGSHMSRDMIPRKMIRAYISTIVDPKGKNSRYNVGKIIYGTYSGFVHAASPHIMDMCGGEPPRFFLSGMLGTPRIEEYQYEILNYYYRGLVYSIIVAKAFGDASLVDFLEEFSFKFQEASKRDFGARWPKTKN